jgi:hypothetical protein
MTNNDLIDLTISKILSSSPAKHKVIIDNLNVADHMELLEILINLADLTIYDMVNNGELIALPYIGHIKIKDGTQNMRIVYNKLFKKYNIQSLSDISEEMQETIKAEFKEEYKQYMRTESLITIKEDIQTGLNNNLKNIVLSLNKT